MTDVTKTGNAKLEKDRHGNYVWRDWIVAKERDGYQAFHTNKLVLCTYPDLKTAKLELPAVDPAVCAGDVPEGFERSNARIRAEYLARPLEERRADVNQRVRQQLQQQVQQYEKDLATFVEAVQNNPTHAIAWKGNDIIVAREIAELCGAALDATDEMLPVVVRRHYDYLGERLLTFSYDETASGVFHRGAGVALRTAHRECRDRLNWILLDYRSAGVPTDEDEE